MLSACVHCFVCTAFEFSNRVLRQSVRWSWTDLVGAGSAWMELWFVAVAVLLLASFIGFSAFPSKGWGKPDPTALEEDHHGGGEKKETL